MVLVNEAASPFGAKIAICDVQNPVLNDKQ